MATETLKQEIEQVKSRTDEVMDRLLLVHSALDAEGHDPEGSVVRGAVAVILDVIRALDDITAVIREDTELSAYLDAAGKEVAHG